MPQVLHVQSKHANSRADYSQTTQVLTFSFHAILPDVRTHLNSRNNWKNTKETSKSCNAIVIRITY